jgi:hypothetical protein
MSLLSRLFGRRPARDPEPDPEIHKGFRIFAVPIREGGGYRVAARIEKEIGGSVKSHRMIRADIFDSAETAFEMSVKKAKVLIDEQGEAVFGA